MTSLILNETDVHNVRGRRIAINNKRNQDKMNAYFILDSRTYYHLNAPHANIAVENKKWLTRAIDQLISGKSQGTCSPQWFSFLRASDFDVQLFLKVLQEIQHHLQEEVFTNSK